MEFKNLPKEINFDIFSRISIKSLYKLGFLCNKCKSLLYLCQEFRLLYHKKHKINPNLLFKKQNNEIPNTTQLSTYYIDGTQLNQFSINFPKILNSILTINGILLLISNLDVLLFDPIIKRVTNLPNSSHFTSNFSWAFGFSNHTNDFKVINFYTIEKFDNFHYCQVKQVMCEIITIPSSQIGLNCNKSWRFLGQCPFNILARKDYANVDGKIYWLIWEKNYNPNDIKIMSFDLGFENFGMIYFPKSYSNRSIECLDLVEINNKLCLIDRLPYESTMSIWMMSNDENGFTNFWEKKYEIDLDQIMGIVHHDVRILGYFNKFIGNCNDDDDESSNDCGNEGEILMKFGEEKFGLFDLQSQAFRELNDGFSNLQGWDLELMIDRKFLL